MDIGEVRVAEDSDFALLKVLVTRNEGWRQEFSQGSIKVWTRQADNSNFRMIRMQTTFKDVSADTLYDVLHDPDYRKTWDKHMLESKDLGVLNPNNDVSYYALYCPTPVRNRDFVLQRSWLQTPKEYYITNHSVFHKDSPPRPGFIRGLSYLTGFLITPLPVGCELRYIAHSDPRGHLPAWVTNKISSIVAPKQVKRLHKACQNYQQWKSLHNPTWKPWINPEQITAPRISVNDCYRPAQESSGDSSPMEDESSLTEADIQLKDDLA